MTTIMVSATLPKNIWKTHKTKPKVHIIISCPIISYSRMTKILLRRNTGIFPFFLHKSWQTILATKHTILHITKPSAWARKLIWKTIVKGYNWQYSIWHCWHHLATLLPAQQKCKRAKTHPVIYLRVKNLNT